MGLKTTLMGKPPQPSTGTSSSSSSNQAYGELNDAFSPAFGYTSQAGSLMGNLLGVNGAPAQTGALENFANSGGMKFLQEQGMRGINSNMAAKGALESGATLKALDKYNQGLASTYLNQYMQNLMDYGKLGLGAGQLVGGAGQVSQSQSKQTGPTQGKQGILPTLLSVGAAAATGGGSLAAGGLGSLGALAPTLGAALPLASMPETNPLDILSSGGYGGL